MKIKFVPQDCWIGLYWKSEFDLNCSLFTTWYICIIPCFPIIFKTYKNK
jgi:hypothetical protein